MNSALAIPEILDEILQLATPSTQAAAAQTCQHWSDRSLRWLWRDMESFYPLLELLSPLTCIGDTWEFSSDLSTSDWNRFSRYATRIHSLDTTLNSPYQGREDCVVSPRILQEFILHCPTLDSMFPKLTKVVWEPKTAANLHPILLFLVPTVKSLHLSCRRPLGEEFISILKVLGPRGIYLTDFELTMRVCGQDFLDRLPAILEDQKTLTSIALPPHSATRAIVAVLGQLPSLKKYTSNIYTEFQAPLEVGMEFDWNNDTFPSLERLTLYTPLANASGLVTKSHQSRLRHLALVDRKPFSNSELLTFCSSLSASQPCLTVIDLSLYSFTTTTMISTQSIPFNYFRSLLRCAALERLLIESHLAVGYGDNDIAAMASSWPNLQVLALCSSPAISIGSDAGQPLRSVGTFARSFHRLAQLGIYVNSLDVGLTSDIHHRRFADINFGTSPPPGSEDVASLYLADEIAIGGTIRGEKGDDHVECLDSNESDERECRYRAAYWSRVSTRVQEIHASTSHLM
ncbi:hypothetical protein FRB94_001389 [Tulasnella sp. JGI-2019a]|nr:hypothetical protein FRB93_013526 [Tulasnella sp. JGI-2019a]KAG9005605.1 hypothetical protein FRB94_001389 [Tulasnella sp. JGI-2019a]